MLRRGEHRVMHLPEIEFQVALFGHLERIPHGLRHLGKARGHLRRRAQVVLPVGVFQAPGIGQQRLRADANQAIMRMRVVPLEVMHVIGRDELQAELFGPRHQLPVDPGLLGQAVLLQLQVEILRPERLLEPVHRRARPRQLIFQNPLRDFARQAAGERQQPFPVFRQQFLVNARLVIIPLRMRPGGQLDQVPIAGFIPGQQHEVMIHIAPAGGGLLLEPASRRHINLAANDGFEAVLPGLLIEVYGAIQHAMVGDRQRRKLQVARLLHQPIQPAGAIEQGILGVQVQVDKFCVRHESSLGRSRHAGQARDAPARARLRAPGRR